MISWIKTVDLRHTLPLHCCKSSKFIGNNVTKKLTEILEHIVSDLSLIFQKSHSCFDFDCNNSLHQTSGLSTKGLQVNKQASWIADLDFGFKDKVSDKRQSFGVVASQLVTSFQCWSRIQLSCKCFDSGNVD